MTVSKKRLDILLVEKGLAQNRQRAQALIMAGNVLVNNDRVDKPGVKFFSDVPIRLKEADFPYVSRGALKLENALISGNIDVTDLTCMDVGASTGGFTDCLLQKGAKRVYAVDVGYGQIAWKLRQDERVVIFERTNIRHMEKKKIPEDLDLAAVETSFLSRGPLWDEAYSLCILPVFQKKERMVGP